jgi:hypothetical protein
VLAAFGVLWLVRSQVPLRISASGRWSARTPRTSNDGYLPHLMRNAIPARKSATSSIRPEHRIDEEQRDQNDREPLAADRFPDEVADAAAQMQEKREATAEQHNYLAEAAQIVETTEERVGEAE